MAKTANFIKQYNTDEVDEALRFKNRFYERFNQKWNDLKLDSMICPALYHCAFKNEDAEILGSVVYYFMLFNVLHFPAGVVPVTEV